MAVTMPTKPLEIGDRATRRGETLEIVKLIHGVPVYWNHTAGQRGICGVDVWYEWLAGNEKAGT